MRTQLFKPGLLAAALLVSGATPAWEYCFDVACPDCGSGFSPQRIFANFDPATGRVSGILQENSDEWGVAAAGKVVVETGMVYFARPKTSGHGIYFYEIDLQTMSGQRRLVEYHVEDEVPYNPVGLRQHTLTPVQCPE